MRSLAAMPVVASLLLCAILRSTSFAAPEADPGDTVLSLLGLQTATVPTLFHGSVTPAMQAAVETFFDDEFRCDGKPGCVESIDTPYEASSLATYLFAYGNETLRHPIRAQDLARHRTIQEPPAEERDPSLERLRAEEKGDLLRQNAESFRESFWKPHLETNRQRLLSSLDRFAGAAIDSAASSSLIVLGAGSCVDIPLESLASRYDVILVDIDLPSMQAARSRLPEELRDRVTLEVRDLSGGIVLRDSKAFDRVLAESVSSQEAMEGLAAVMESAVVPTPLLEGQHRAGALISSMLVSQVPFYLVMQIVETMRDPNVGLEGQGWSPRFEAAVREYSSRIADAHAEALRDFCVRTGGFVYYASDIVLERSVLEFGAVDDVLPSRQGDRIPSLWHRGRPVTDLSELFRSSSQLLILEDGTPWIWEHLHPVLQERWSAVRTENLCVPLQGDSCWSAGPRRFKVGRRFLVDSVAFTRR